MEGTQQSTYTPSQDILDVVSFIAKSKEERNQALEITLAYSGTEENRNMFKGTEIIKQLLRAIPEPDSTLSTLKCLIQFSQD